MRSGKGTADFKFNIVFAVDKFFIGVADIYYVAVICIVKQTVVTVYLHFERLDEYAAHVGHESHSICRPFAAAEPCLVAVCHISPCRIDRAQYHKLHGTTEFVLLFYGDSHAFGIYAPLVVDVILQAELGTDELITDFRVKAYGKTL